MTTPAIYARESGEKANVFIFECSGTKTQGSGSATGFPMHHPILVRYKLDLNEPTLKEVDIDTHELSAGEEPIAVQIFGKNLSTTFHNQNLGKDYEIQIRGEERLFSITIYPSNNIDPDTWYGQCINK